MTRIGSGRGIFVEDAERMDISWRDSLVLEISCGLCVKGLRIRFIFVFRKKILRCIAKITYVNRHEKTADHKFFCYL